MPKDPIARFLAINAWARRRYARDGWIVAYIGFEPTRFTRIIDAAWRRYLIERA